MIIYWYRFKNNVKNKLIFDETAVSILNKFIEWVIEIDNALYKWVMKQKYNNE